jgi:hypothetical protein
MKASFGFLAALVLIVPFHAHADSPVPVWLGIGPPQALPGGRDVVWSQPGDQNGNIVTSEIIDDFALESQTADDFMLEIDGEVRLDHVRWWGGEYGWAPGNPEMTVFNLLFYEDDPDPGICAPVDEPYATFLGLTPERTLVESVFGQQIWIYDQDISFDVPGHTTIWLVVQAADHPFSPQWGRLEAFESMGCPAHIRSVFFGYPDWTPIRDGVDPEYQDASLELSGTVLPVATQPSSWGRVRGLYR